MSEMSLIQTNAALGPVTGTAPKIPSHLLSSFSAVAHHKSVAHAATAQCVPYAQMAQNIARLEGLMGQPVIDPQPGAFRLTDTGRALDAAVSPSLAQAERHAQTVISTPFTPSPNRPTITVGLGIWGVAAMLKPYLPQLQGLDCGLNFAPQSLIEETTPDVVCYLGKAARAGYEIEPLFGEEVIAVCSTKYPVPKGGFNAATLHYEPLLELGHTDHTQDWHGFLGIDPDMDLPGINKEPYKSFSAYSKAIKSGRGIGVGLAPLFAADIAAGTMQLASTRRVWRNRTIYLGVAKDSEFITQSRAFAAIVKQAFGDVDMVAH
ncbi:MAG: LysR family transcriptional regulator [Planktomarina sp.]